MQQKQPMLHKHMLKIQFYPASEEECLEDGFVMLVDLRTKFYPDPEAEEECLEYGFLCRLKNQTPTYQLANIGKAKAASLGGKEKKGKAI